MASGVPALFKKGKQPKDEPDVEAGEGEELLEKKKSAEDSNKEGELEEVKVDEGGEKKDPSADDAKSQGSEKRDPEKGEAGGAGDEDDPLARVKAIPGELYTRFQGLERDKQLGVLGMIGGIVLILFIIIIAAACTPGSWYNYHRFVEDGKYIETQTSCGKVWGKVEGDGDVFRFTGIPYSATVPRFSHSKLPKTLLDCHEDVLNANQTVACEEDENSCLTVEVLTSSVVYDSQMPVVVYVASDKADLGPGGDVARDNGVVFVTVNVRRGVLGFMSHPALSDKAYPPTSGNYGLGDLITALRWVRNNVIHFGGHPGRVTVLGHLEGATLATALSAAEEADGLFHQLWLSGGAGVFPNATLETAGRENQAIVNGLSCGNDIYACLLSARVTDLTSAIPGSWFTKPALPASWEGRRHSWLVADTQLLTASPPQAWTQRKIKIPVVFGNFINYILVYFLFISIIFFFFLIFASHYF